MLFGWNKAGVLLDDEFRFHLERQIAENAASGMNAEEARAAALRAFGNPALLRDQAHDTWSWLWLESLLRDAKYGVRTLLRTPGFAAIAILVMALGVGANVAMFTVVRGVLLKPLPFVDPDRLVMLYERGIPDDSQQFAYNGVAGGVFDEWRKQNHSYTDIALVKDQEQDGLSATGRQSPENVSGAVCTWNLFSILGVRPALGRDFNAGDDSLSSDGTVMLSWNLWKRRFGGDPRIVNQTIYVNASPRTVIGVMPEWFAFPDSTSQLWMPVYRARPKKLMKALDFHQFNVVGRLKPGVTANQGVADLSVISRRLHDQHLENPFVSKAANSRPLLEHMVGEIKRPLYMLLAATGCVLLIACLNVANLLIARAAARRKELAIRTALGGGWLRLLRERLVESLLLTCTGGAAGLILALAALEWMARTRHDISRIESVHIDGAVAAFTVGVIAACALFSGLISALSTKDKNVLQTLHESSRGYSGGKSRTALRRVLLSLEVGLTVVLLIGAGLLLKSYQRLRSADLGCTTQNVLTMRFVLPAVRYSTPAQRANFFDAVLARVRALPGAESAAFVTAVPGTGYYSDWGFTIVEHPPQPRGSGTFAINRWADPGYFAALGIPLLRGQTFDPGLRLDSANQVVISDSFAKRFFPGEDPLGKHLRSINIDRDTVIVGIVGDTRYSLGEPALPMQYYPLAAGISNAGTLVVRSRNDAQDLSIPTQRIVQDLDHDLPVSDVLTMDQLLGKSTVDQKFDTTLLLAFGALSLLLAAVGLFGVLSYIVAQRTSEIGIRMALGAPRENVLRRVLLDGLRPAFAGLLLGLAASAGLVRLLRSMLYETRPFDPWVFAGVAATLLVVAMLACMLPAWRASRVDPIQALRIE
jgi:putative ABC transport system permease protein